MRKQANRVPFDSEDDPNIPDGLSNDQLRDMWNRCRSGDLGGALTLENVQLLILMVAEERERMAYEKTAKSFSGKIKKMKKEIEKPAGGCYEKGKANGEQLFTLRSQDVTMALVIAYWIKANIYTAPEAKLRHALDIALEARNWPNQKRAD